MAQGLLDNEKHFLSPANGKRRDEHAATRLDHLRHAADQQVFRGPPVRVHAVAVGGLRDEQIHRQARPV